MTKEERKEYLKKYREAHKEEMSEYLKKYREAHKEEMSEYLKKYREAHKENHDKIAKRCKKYREKNREILLEKLRKYRGKNYDFCILGERVSKFYRKKYFRYFSSIENYLTILKLGDDSLKRSIMTKLGKGTILEDEAIALSGMTWTEEDQIELDDYWKRSTIKRSSSNC